MTPARFRRVVGAACALILSLIRFNSAIADDVDWQSIWREARAKDKADYHGGLTSGGEAVPRPYGEPIPFSGDIPIEPGHDLPRTAPLNVDRPVEAPPSTHSVKEDLPPLAAELFQHGGSYLYQAGGDRLGWPAAGTSHHQFLRLPANWQAPDPVTAFAEFQGADPVTQYPAGPSGYSIDPRFVAAGSYSAFGLAFQQDDVHRDAIGHQVVLDFDLQLTGTERFHVQWRPVGERMSGGSYYQFGQPDGYVDNSTVEPDRYWFEAELHSLIGPCGDPLAAKNTSMLFGKFPFAMHNNLLMNDEILGAVISRNNIPLGQLSNFNLQAFAGFNDVDTYAGVESQVLGLHATIDHRKRLYEASYAYLNSHGQRDTHFLGISGTRFFGPLSVAGRALFKIGDEGGTGDSQLFVLESNFVRAFHHNCTGVEKGVFFSNAFWAGDGWNSIGGANFNRLRTGFEVNPLIRLSATPDSRDTLGATVGVQLFRHREDESIIPEIAVEQPNGETVYGAGLRYLRKTGAQTYLEVLGVINRGPGATYDRNGIFASHTIVF